MRSRSARSTASGSGDAVPGDASSYPGGKSGAGVYQRLINLIPRHRILIVPFAGRCGVTRRIRPAEHTILIDPDPDVCLWWDDWSRRPEGRSIELHQCDGIEWLRYRCGVTLAPRGLAAGNGDAAGESVTGRGRVDRRRFIDESAAASPTDAAEAFVLCDPPYVLSERATGRIYDHELTDADHLRLLQVLTRLPASQYSAMLCGYESPLYASLEPWRRLRHRVPTRGGLQDEMIWLNYPEPELLHDHRYVGRTRRERERIRRRQKTVTAMLAAMDPRERAAMVEAIGDNASHQ